jgi:glucose-6-phosphate-specific signal transduction histidine kinase
MENHKESVFIVEQSYSTVLYLCTAVLLGLMLTLPRKLRPYIYIAGHVTIRLYTQALNDEQSHSNLFCKWTQPKWTETEIYIPTHTVLSSSVFNIVTY